MYAHNYYNECTCIQLSINTLPCGEILGAVFIGISWQKQAATFGDQWDFEVQQDFEEI